MFQEIKPLFDRLSNKELISSCSMGITQNANESFHHVVWSLAPKESFCSAAEFRLAVDIAVLIFNCGRQEAICKILAAASLPITADTSLIIMDRKRKLESQRNSTEVTKKKRKMKRKFKLTMITAFQHAEGITYHGGDFTTGITDDNPTRKAPRCRKCDQPTKGHKRGHCVAATPDHDNVSHYENISRN